MPPIVIYTGPSMLDGAPIVALATLGSSNVKTGPMVQTWIMRADLRPVDAARALADRSVCGDCPRRQSTGGDCYVLVHNAPQSAYKAWERAGKPAGDVLASARACERDARAHGVRLGSYGDPAAVPHRVWSEWLGALKNPRHTGYTHQWRATLFAGPDAYAHHTWCRENLMASVDSVREATLARASGWRYFLAIPATERAPLPRATVECPAVRESSLATCRTCGICDGAQGRPMRASVYLHEHGARSSSKARRAASLRVLAA